MTRSEHHDDQWVGLVSHPDDCPRCNEYREMIEKLRPIERAKVMAETHRAVQNTTRKYQDLVTLVNIYRGALQDIINYNLRHRHEYQAIARRALKSTRNCWESIDAR